MDVVESIQCQQNDRDYQWLGCIDAIITALTEEKCWK